MLKYCVFEKKCNSRFTGSLKYNREFMVVDLSEVLSLECGLVQSDLFTCWGIIDDPFWQV